jgi:hypothetical protein
MLYLPPVNTLLPPVMQRHDVLVPVSLEFLLLALICAALLIVDHTLRQ